MNKFLKIVLSVFVLLILVSCSSGGTNENQENGTSANGNNADTDSSESLDSEEFEFRGEMPLQTQLLIGSLMLEETDMAISPEQAEDLIPLWQLTINMSESGTAVQEEFDAVMDAIQAVMTTEQLTYLEGIEFEQGLIQELMADLGIAPDSRGDGENEGGFTPGGFGGGIPGQGPGGGGQGFAEGNLPPEQQATFEALREEGGGRGESNRANIFLTNGLITVLEGKLE